MSADVADRKDIILEQFVLDGGVVVLDSWRLQIRNGSENAERRRARGVRPVGLEGNGRIRASGLRADASPVGPRCASLRVQSPGVRRRVVTGVRPKGLGESCEARLTSQIRVDEARQEV